MFYKYIIRPLLFLMEAENAHNVTAQWANRFTYSKRLSRFVRGLYNYQSMRLAQSFWGLTFRNPVGLAAGFDKNGRMVKAMENLGMGFTEVGSVTMRGAKGNKRPRVFRLPEDSALINRMGLNNNGVRAVVRSMEHSDIIPVGINIAKTHDNEIMGDDAIRDYQVSYREAQKIADYITVNISCPNTSDGRTFEDPAALKELLEALVGGGNREKPTLVKFSPDLSRDELDELIDICEHYNMDGYAACNTSAERGRLSTNSSNLEAIGKGGLSGKPIFKKSLATVKHIREIAGSEKPIIGIGGIRSFKSALQMLEAGADLLQVYTGFIYEGPALLKNINRGLNNYLKEHHLKSIEELK